MNISHFEEPFGPYIQFISTVSSHCCWLFSFNHSLVWYMYTPQLVRAKLGQGPSNHATSTGSITAIKPLRTKKRRASGFHWLSEATISLVEIANVAVNPIIYGCGANCSLVPVAYKDKFIKLTSLHLINASVYPQQTVNLVDN